MRAERFRYFTAIGVVRYWRWLIVLTLVLTAFLIGRCGGGDETGVHPTVDVTMPDRPEVKPTIRERIVYRNVPVERRVVETEVDTVVVREFVEAATDTLREPMHLPYSIEYDGDRLLMWGVMSDGTRSLAEYDVKPTFRAGWDADSTWAREERLARFPTKRVLVGAGVVAASLAIVLAVR